MQFKIISIIFLLCALAYAQPLVEGMKLIQKNQAKEGILLLDRSFNELTNKDKLIAANLIAISPAKVETINSKGYYAQYTLKLNKNLDLEEQAKLHRVLADESLDQANFKFSIENYLRGIKKTKIETLKDYMIYKLGWSYVNNKEYLKMFKLWSPVLAKESTLLEPLTHDYAKFWVEYLDKNKYYPLNINKALKQSELTKGAKDGLIRTKLTAKKLKKRLNSQEYTLIVNAELLKQRDTDKCILESYIDKTDFSQIDAALLEKHLSLCLKLKSKEELLSLKPTLNNTELPALLKSIYFSKTGLDTKLCAEITNAIKENLNPKKLYALFELKNNCSIASELINKYVRKYKDSSLEIYQEGIFANSHKEIFPKKAHTNRLTGLIGSKHFLNEASLIQKPASNILLEHLYTYPNLKKEDANKLFEIMDNKYKTEATVLISNNFDNLSKEVSVKELVSSCKNFTSNGVPELINYTIKYMRSEFILELSNCLDFSTYEKDAAFINAITLSEYQGEQKTKITDMNKIVFNKNFFTKKDSELKKVHYPLYILNRAKYRLFNQRLKNKQQLADFDKKISFYRNKFRQAKWLNRVTQENAIQLFNDYLNSFITRLSKIGLEAAQVALLEERYTKMRLEL